VGRLASTFAVVLLVTLGVPSHEARTQIGVFEPMDTPIPKEWREPIAGFFRDLGASDTHSLLENTKIGPNLRLHHADSITFRIEHRAVCDEDVCLTVIGRIESGTFVPQVMFGAGKMTTVGDYGARLLGFGTLPMWFKSNKGVVTVLESPRGWIIVP
jgi:hypothetical protein